MSKKMCCIFVRNVLNLCKECTDSAEIFSVFRGVKIMQELREKFEVLNLCKECVEKFAAYL